MNVTTHEELGAWFNREHAWDVPATVAEASARFLSDAFAAIPWPVVFIESQPYESAKEMRETVEKTGILLISREGNSGPLSKITVAAPKPYYVLDANLMFRAVHDQHHVLLKAPFNFSGEARASAHMLRLIFEYGVQHGWTWTLIQEVKAFHFSEMMGQVSYYYCNGRQYLDSQYAVRYPVQAVEDFEDYWTKRQQQLNAKEG